MNRNIVLKSVSNADLPRGPIALLTFRAVSAIECNGLRRQSPDCHDGSTSDPETLVDAAVAQVDTKF
jgi:hypothetical protein